MACRLTSYAAGLPQQSYPVQGEVLQVTQLSIRAQHYAFSVASLAVIFRSTCRWHSADSERRMLCTSAFCSPESCMCTAMMGRHAQQHCWPHSQSCSPWRLACYWRCGLANIPTFRNLHIEWFMSRMIYPSHLGKIACFFCCRGARMCRQKCCSCQRRICSLCQQKLKLFLAALG